MPREAIAEGVSVPQEEPFKEKCWARYTLNKAADWKLREHHLHSMFFCFFFKRSGHCSWVGVRANRSLPQVELLYLLVLELPAQTHDLAKNIGWIVENRCQRGLKTELEFA